MVVVLGSTVISLVFLALTALATLSRLAFNLTRSHKLPAKEREQETRSGYTAQAINRCFPN
jgi:hypothetical protein